jgi:hypothetical protein
MLGPEVRDANVAVVAAVAPAQVSADPALGRLGVRVIAIVEDHQLHMAEDDLDWIIVRAAFGQTDPVQEQGAHHPPGLARFAGMRPILIEGHPERKVRIPATHLLHELANTLGILAWQKHPMHLATDRVIAHEQVEVPAGLLIARQHQSLGRGVTPTAVGFDRNGLDVEEQQPAVGWQIPKNPADPGQDGEAAGILTDELALDAPKADVVFLALAASAPARWISRYVS